MPCPPPNQCKTFHSGLAREARSSALLLARSALFRSSLGAKRALPFFSWREARSSVLLLARSALAPGARKALQPNARKYVEPKVLARSLRQGSRSASDHDRRMRWRPTRTDRTGACDLSRRASGRAHLKAARQETQTLAPSIPGRSNPINPRLTPPAPLASGLGVGSARTRCA